MTTFSLSVLNAAQNRGEIILGELLCQIEMQFGVEFPADDQPIETYLDASQITHLGEIVARVFPFVRRADIRGSQSLKDIQFEIQQHCTAEPELFA
jgi:hypothetical protein